MYRRILVPLDGSERADAALPWAATIPCERVRLLRVEPPGDAEPDVPDFGPQTSLLELANIVVEPRAVRGDPAEEIVRAAEDADLIVMATSARGAGGRRIYGSVADRVARHAPAPTLLIRAGNRPVENAPAARLLVPLDCSPASDRATPVATALARALGIGVHVVIVAGPEETPTRRNAGGIAPPSGPTRAAAATHIGALEQEIAADVAGFSAEIRQGDPAGEILDAIEPGDLLVMTTHGGGGAQRWAIGTVAEEVLRRAPVAVLLVRADGRPESGR